MNRSFAGPLALSLAGHGAAAALLLAFAGHLLTPLAPPPPKPRGIEIMLAPPAPVAPKPLPAVKEAPPPPPPPPVVKEEPPTRPPPVIKKEPPRPRSRPVVRRPPPQREVPPRETYREPPPAYYPPPVEYTAPVPPQTAAIPPQPPPAPRPAGPVVSAAYRGLLSAWIERHKSYPETARQRGEAGSGVLRFHVDRSGRVLDYAVVRSTGYPDLDAAIDRMMQGARLPPFPADMTASDVEVSVTIRFALAQ